MLSITGESCHKYHFCRDKTHLLSRQKYAYRDKGFVATSILLSRQARVCRDKTHVCRDKRTVLSRQTYACRDKTFVVTDICRNKHVFVARRACRDKTFVATKMILVAAPASYN